MSAVPIIDPHVHLWDPRTTPRQISGLVRLIGRWPGMLERVVRTLTPGALVEFVGDPRYVLGPHLPEDLRAGAGRHDVTGIVHVEAGWTERGPLGPVGETRWLDALDEPPLGIVGHVTVDDPVLLQRQLDAHTAASDRFRGVRDILAAHPDERVHDWSAPERVRSDAVRAGLATLGERGLTFEAWCLHPQLPDVAALAADVPATTIMLDHLGTPVGLAGPHRGQGTTESERAAIHAAWQEGVVAVAAQPNVHCKLSGLLMPICGFGFHRRSARPSVDEVVHALAPHVLFGIETFGVERCVLASNFPMDKVSVDYDVLWDALFQITEGLGPDAQRRLAHDNAAAFYRLEL